MHLPADILDPIPLKMPPTRKLVSAIASSVYRLFGDEALQRKAKLP
jgi:hypothetical protein